MGWSLAVIASHRFAVAGIRVTAGHFVLDITG